MIVAVTGHRPDKLGGYEFHNPKRVWVRDRLREKLLEHKPDHCISGMALGVDQDFAYVCIEMAIPFTAAIPFVGQESKWPQAAQQFYRELRDKAVSVVVVSGGGYAAWKMQTRNEWMVDHCDLLIAVWDGTDGGTGNCVKYADKKGRLMDRINPNDFERWYGT